MVLLTHICGDMPAMARMLGRRGHTSKNFCHRCTGRPYDDFSSEAHSHHQSHEEYILKARAVDEVYSKWTQGLAGDKQLKDAKAEHGINMYSSMFDYLAYVDVMYTAHTALMHCVLYGVYKNTLAVLFEAEARAVPEGVRSDYAISTGAQRALASRAKTLVFTSEESRSYRCVVEWRKRYTMEEYKDLLLGSASALFRPYRDGQGRKQEVLPRGAKLLLQALYVYAAHFFSAHPVTCTEEHRRKAVDALEQYIGRVRQDVRCLQGHDSSTNIYPPTGTDHAADTQPAPIMVLPAVRGAGLRAGHGVSGGLHGAGSAGGQKERSG